MRKESVKFGEIGGRFNSAFPLRILVLIILGTADLIHTMLRRLVIVATICCSGVFGGTVAGATVSDWLDIPPAFVRLFGDAAIDERAGEASVKLTGVGKFDPKGGFSRRIQKPRVIVVSPAGESGASRQERLARSLSERFFDEVIDESNLTMHEQRVRMQELIPMTREGFVSMSTRRLLRRPGNPKWFDEAWWVARMGLPMHLDPDHQLIIMNLFWDRGRGKVGTAHFCFALREKGGNAEQDLVFDFRAEWYVDRRAKPAEALNLANNLPMHGYTRNLYDWLYTQTEYRNCHTDFWFLPIYREQTALLRYFSEEVKVHDACQFKPIRRNCVTLGLSFLNRTKPFRFPVQMGKGVADIPVQAARRYIRAYDDPPYFRLTNYTDDLNREPTMKSEIHCAQPSRATCRPFRELKEFENRELTGR